MTESRWIELETRLSYVDDTVRVLNDIVAQQQARIDQLEATCRALGERLRRTERGDGAPPVDERPPHY